MLTLYPAPYKLHLHSSCNHVQVPTRLDALYGFVCMSVFSGTQRVVEHLNTWMKQPKFKDLANAPCPRRGATSRWQQVARDWIDVDHFLFPSTQVAGLVRIFTLTREYSHWPARVTLIMRCAEWSKKTELQWESMVFFFLFSYSAWPFLLLEMHWSCIHQTRRLSFVLVYPEVDWGRIFRLKSLVSVWCQSFIVKCESLFSQLN